MAPMAMPQIARIARAAEQRPALVLSGVLIAALALFVDKAFTVDDPLFIWLAKQIQAQPLDFFGFDVNWYGVEEPMSGVTMNPPLAGYFLALAGSLFGWSERALHLALLLPALGALLATHALARRLCDGPIEAALITLFTPAFLISSSNVMCDTLMLAFFCLALWLWIDGLEKGDRRRLMAAGLCAGLAGLTKFFGLAVVPLMLAYGLIKRRSLGAWCLPLLVPLLAMAGYEVVTHTLYGTGHVLQAAFYAAAPSMESEQAMVRRAFVGLVFAGGCLVPALLYAPALWGGRVLALAWASLLVMVVFSRQTLGLLDVEVVTEELASWYAIQLAALALGGVGVLALGLSDWWRRRDAESALLALWIVGTLVFAAFLNWTNNGRSNLPMAPALGILIVRRVDLRRAETGKPVVVLRTAALALSVVLALAVARADYEWANDVRSSARALAARYAGGDRTAWFQGHWGFQYYMEEGGARPLDSNTHVIRRGELLIVPQNNTAVFPNPPARVARLVEERSDPEAGWLRTMSPDLGAGFYSSMTGILPFVFGRGHPDTYKVLEMTRPTQIKLE